MTTIWKYSIPSDTFILDLPIDSRILSVQLQHDKPVMWVLVDPENPVKGRHFEIYGTGYEIPPEMAYISTYQHGPFVWHLFEKL